MSKPSFKPGWKMTWSQHNRYWKEFGQCCAKRKIPSAEREAFRSQLHIETFGENISAKEIDHLKGVDKIFATFKAILNDTDLGGQMRQLDQPRVRLIYKIRQLADAPYIQALLESPRFRAESLEDLDEKDLTDFRNTCDARMGAARRREREAAENEVPEDAELATVTEEEPF